MTRANVFRIEAMLLEEYALQLMVPHLRRDQPSLCARVEEAHSAMDGLVRVDGEEPYFMAANMPSSAMDGGGGGDGSETRQAQDFSSSEYSEDE